MTTGKGRFEPVNSLIIEKKGVTEFLITPLLSGDRTCITTEKTPLILRGQYADQEPGNFIST
jgi:hypothetical protein